MPRVDLDRIDTNDFCCRCDSVPIAHGTLTALIAELRAARAVVEAVRHMDACYYHNADGTITLNPIGEAIRAYDAATQPERDEDGK